MHLLALEQDGAFGDFAALGVQQIGDRLERGGLASAVGAQQRDDAAARHVERDALQHEDHVIVDHLDVVDRKDAVGAGVGLRGIWCGHGAIRRKNG